MGGILRREPLDGVTIHRIVFMGGYDFTDAVRWSLQAAREEAAALQHTFVGPEPPHPRMARRSELTESPHPMRRATAPNLAKLAPLLAATALGVSITALLLSLR
jgi:hypothetical protein